MSELAQYRITMAIEGMEIDGLPAGVGDRKLEFTAPMPADDPEMANEVWYTHLEALFGEAEQQKLRTAAEGYLRNRR